MDFLLDDGFQQERRLAFGTLIKKIEARRDAEPQAGLILAVGDLSPQQAEAEARRTVWSLFRDALAHLKDGGVGGAPGSFTRAVEKISLRSSPLSQSLGVPPPTYRRQLMLVESYENGHDAALRTTLRLMEAARADAHRSMRLILRAVDQQDESKAFGMPAMAEDLRELFKLAGHGAFSEENRKAFKAQTILAAETLGRVYSDTCASFKDDIYRAIDALQKAERDGFDPLPPPRRGSGKFKLS